MDWLLDFFKENRTFGAQRSGLWPSVRKQHLKRFPTCAVCGGTDTLEVHHIFPVHNHQELELNFQNLITLCESGKNGIVCHRAIGHLGDYKSFNKDVEQDAYLLNKKIINRP